MVERHYTGLAKAEKGFGDEAIDLAGDIKKLMDTIDGLNFVGNDDTAKKFKEGYQKAHDNLRTYVNELITAYGKISTRVGRMSDNTTLAEWMADISAGLPKVPDGPTDKLSQDGK